MEVVLRVGCPIVLTQFGQIVWVVCILNPWYCLRLMVGDGLHLEECDLHMELTNLLALNMEMPFDRVCGRLCQDD